MIPDTTLFYDKLTTAFNNPYAAVVYVAKLARQLAATLDYSILDSQAITWAISGIKPEPIKLHSYIKNRVNLPVSDTLSLIDDSDVKEAVMLSLRRTVSNYLDHTNNTLYNNDDKVVQYSADFMSKLIINHTIDSKFIIFDYGKVTDESKQSRIRILVRLICDNFEY